MALPYADGKPDASTQTSYRRLKQLQLVVKHIESSAAYLLGSGIEPQGDREENETTEIAKRVLESLEAERERLYRDVRAGLYHPPSDDQAFALLGRLALEAQQPPRAPS